MIRERRDKSTNGFSHTHLLVASLLFLATATTSAARADWMNLTGAETAPNIAEITVLDDRVRVALECEPSRKSMHVTTRSRRLCVTLWLRGTR